MTSIDTIDMQIKELIAYIHSKITAKDWHAVQDAASDIRELEAKREILSIFYKEGQIVVPIVNDTGWKPGPV